MSLPRSGSSSTVSRSNWILECWFLWREENHRTWRKTISRKEELKDAFFDSMMILNIVTSGGLMHCDPLTLVWDIELNEFFGKRGKPENPEKKH